MGGIKRKEAPDAAKKGTKKQKVSTDKPVEKKRSKLEEAADDEGDEFEAFEEEGEPDGQDHKLNGKRSQLSSASTDPKKFKLDTSSAEAHAKQRALAKERKAAKPNADIIGRSKKIWERLRIKSAISKEERKELVSELFGIINGRVRDFVFKHDSVRVIQCALKYADKEQRRTIVEELRADIRPLVESRYGKFLVAKMVVEGDQEVRNIIVPEFYGHVKRLINHPEASWIVDDIYRQVATQKQKTAMLREWYGAEFALTNRDTKVAEGEHTAVLTEILEKNPEKRRPILEATRQLINSLVQKKMTGFTMLHDAMLQYFLALTPGSEEHTEFLETLKGDIDAEIEGGGGDLYRNLAFTKSGSRLACLAIAYGSAKDRKVILRCYRDNIEMMAFDHYAKHVLIAGLDLPDDTKMSGKAILGELLSSATGDDDTKLDRLEGILTNTHARLPVLYPLAGQAKWLTLDPDNAIIEEIHTIRETTSKKEPELRRQGLLEHLSAPLLDLVTKRASTLVQSSMGCQCIAETLLHTKADSKADAKQAIAELAAGDPTSDGHIAKSAAAGRMLRTLVLGGKFDPATKTTILSEPRLGFASALWPTIKNHVVEWACSDSSFVVVSLLESEDVDDKVKSDVKAAVAKGLKRIEAAAKPSVAGKEGGKSNGKKGASAAASGASSKGNAGARILLDKL